MKILLASDGSEQSTKAAKFLLRFDQDEPIDVAIVTVSQPPISVVDEHYLAHDDEGWKEREQKRVEKEQASTAQLFSDSKWNVSKEHLFGNPAQEIIHRAGEWNADLIVLGAQGHSMLHRVLLGSISEQVANHAECSVLIARERSGADGESGGVVVAYDGSDPSRATVDEMLQLPWGASPELSLVSVAQRYDLLMSEGVSAAVIENEEALHEHMRTLNVAMTDQIVNKWPNVKSVVTRTHHVGDGVVDYAENSGADFIFVGDAGHNFVERLLLGSTTRFVMRHAPCSVWISRADRRKKMQPGKQEAVASN